MLELLGNLFGAVKNIFGWADTRQKIKNSPEMVQAKTAQNEVKKQDEINKSVEKGDLDDIRKLGAE